MIHRWPRRVRLLLASALATLSACPTLATPSGVSASGFHSYAISQDNPAQGTRLDEVISSRWDLPYSGTPDPYNCNPANYSSAPTGPYTVIDDMWLDYDSSTSPNWVEFATFHCIDQSGVDHLWWAGGAQQWGSGTFAWRWWKPATANSAHRFYLFQESNQNFYWYVDNTLMFNTPFHWPDPSAIFAQVGMESYDSSAVTPYHDSWGMVTQYNSVNGTGWLESGERVDAPAMYGSPTASDTWDDAENQSNQGCHYGVDTLHLLGAARTSADVGC